VSSIVRVYCHASYVSDDVGVDAYLLVHRYRYMLEAFIDKIRGRNPEYWFDAQDSITNLEWVEAVYKEVRSIIMSLVPIAFRFVSRTFGASLLTSPPFFHRPG
jgi:hypothetical protein